MSEGQLNNPEESKAEKFIRIGESRVNKAMESINRLENLSNRNTYEYTEDQVEAMFSSLENRLAEIKSKFAPKKQETSTFSFGK